jgi:hypothetical protein
MGVGIALTKDTCWLPSSSAGRLAADYLIYELQDDMARPIKDRIKEMYLYLGAIAELEDATPNDIELLYAAALRAYKRLIEEGPKGWQMPEFFPGFVDRFRELLHYIRSDTRLPSTVPDLPEDVRAFRDFRVTCRIEDGSSKGCG